MYGNRGGSSGSQAITGYSFVYYYSTYAAMKAHVSHEGHLFGERGRERESQVWWFWCSGQGAR